MRGSLLDIAERYTSAENGSDEGVAQAVRADRLVDPGPTGHPAHHAGGPMPVESLAVAGSEDRPRRSFADRPGRWIWPSGAPKG